MTFMIFGKRIQLPAGLMTGREQEEWIYQLHSLPVNLCLWRHTPLAKSNEKPKNKEACYFDLKHRTGLEAERRSGKERENIGCAAPL